MKKATFELQDDGYVTDGPKTKRCVVECGVVHITVVFLVFCVITTAVALLVFYLPQRSDIAGTKAPVRVSKPTVTSDSTDFRTTGFSGTLGRQTQPQTQSQTQSQTQPVLHSTPTPVDIGTTSDPMTIGRLPRSVLPRRYQLNIRPYLYEEDAPYAALGRSSTFDGRVRIKVECVEPTDVIVLHSDELTIQGKPNVTRLDSEKSSGDILSDFTLDAELMFLTLKLKESLEPRKHYEIEIEFSGVLNVGKYSVRCEGLFVSWYETEDGEKRLTLASQMEGAYARRVLPCFDEPSFKSSFDVRIDHRYNMSALSNGMETSTVRLEDYWSRTYFERVADMPTYLLALVVHDFQNISAVTEDGYLVRVWMAPGDMQDASADLVDAVKLQEFFTSYSGIKYSLPKLDHIGVQLMSDAMENWGLIIYNEKYLKETDTLTITHEVSHQWFGNLVTPEWWNDLWLNEGFASYCEHLGIDYLDPSQNAYENFYRSKMASSFSIDVGNYKVRTLIQPVSSKATDIQNQLVTFTYVKGASILFMVKHFLAEGVFEAGIRNYLKERAYKNANGDHLWEELTYADQDVGKHDIKTIMDSWTLQPGAPVVNLNRTGNVVVAKQERLYTGYRPPREPLRERYIIPFTYVHGSEPSAPKNLFLQPENEETILTLDGASESDWYLANFKQTGYYFANYDMQNWQRIVEQAERDPSVFTYQNQIGLISQTNELRHGKLLPVSIYVSLLEAFKNTTQRTREAILQIELDDMSMRTGQRSRSTLQRRIIDDINKLYSAVGWNEDATMNPLGSRRYPQQKRLDITSVACFYGNSDCVARATSLFKKIVENPGNNSVKPAFRPVVYCNGVRYGGRAEWNYAWKQMHEASGRLAKTQWGLALTCSSNISALARLAEYMSTTSSDLDEPRIVIALAANLVCQDLAWDYFRNHWDRLYASGELNDDKASELLEAIAATVNTAHTFQELLEFERGRNFGSAEDAYETAVTRASRQVYWSDDNFDH